MSDHLQKRRVSLQRLEPSTQSFTIESDTQILGTAVISNIPHLVILKGVARVKSDIEVFIVKDKQNLVYETGMRPDYLGTVVLNSGELILHVFTRRH